ncbi:hypothetical protein XV03_03985 [Mycobacterium avium subsp. hominissuis]|uniref:Uncharacterized protein n=1 Tax=Mycobacterium avium subsp. hominissuis TaxID=439334 RepID=A0A2A3LD18_MYCAV|nr:hypothetical protein XV03_03985 [Mycobacterium avium subsp. hominissuis]
MPFLPERLSQAAGGGHRVDLLGARVLRVAAGVSALRILMWRGGRVLLLVGTVLRLGAWPVLLRVIRLRRSISRILTSPRCALIWVHRLSGTEPRRRSRGPRRRWGRRGSLLLREMMGAGRARFQVMADRDALRPELALQFGGFLFGEGSSGLIVDRWRPRRCRPGRFPRDRLRLWRCGGFGVRAAVAAAEQVSRRRVPAAAVLVVAP